MSYMKRIITNIEESNRLSDIPLDTDYEAIWLQDELEMAIQDHDYDRASQLMSMLEAHTIQ